MSKKGMNYREGYCDGIAGAGMQWRTGRGSTSYRDGFACGSRDRKAMLASQANAERSPC